MKGTLYTVTLRTQREFRAWCERLRTLYRLDPLPPRHVTRTFYDTFDWRLFQNGWALEFDADAAPIARLRGLGAEGIYAEEVLAEVPRFAHEFPDGPLHGPLQAAAGVRALAAVGTVGLRVVAFRVSDRREKLVFQLEQEQLHSPGDARRGRTLAVFARIRTLRGYAKAGREALALLGERGAPRTRGPGPFERCMRLAGRVPGDYSTRLRVEFPPGIGARAAVARILLFLLDVMERNLPGVAADLDVEFLHDLRIAARRSRSIINKTQGVFTAPELARFKREFSWLSDVTSARRDLDVFLYALPAYVADLGAERSAPLEPLRVLLAEERRAEHARLAVVLESERLRAFMREWREFLQRVAADPDDRGGPLRDVAGRSIRRLYRRILKRAPQAGAGLYTEALHELRKTGKQLRYLIEAFRGLYPEDEIELIVAQLRKLQNVLGDIVDFHVQRTRVLEWRERLQARADTPAEAFAALDRLAERFDALERRSAERFLGRYARFAAPETRERIDRLFTEAA